MVQQDSPSLGLLDESSQFPRLSINDLLLLTLTVSFSLACIVPSLEGILTDEEWESIITLVTKQLMVGIKLFGFIVVVRNWARSQSSTVAPGHWVFLRSGRSLSFYSFPCRYLRLYTHDGPHCTKRSRRSCFLPQLACAGEQQCNLPNGVGELAWECWAAGY